MDAGRQLAEKLVAHAGRRGVIVLGLPRGGVPVAEQVASALGSPLDVFVVRKLGVPGQEELAMGAVATGGVRVVNLEVVAGLDISDEMLQYGAEEELGEVVLRERAYRGDRSPVELRDRTVILVDDGLATGASMRAAVEATRALGPARIVVAVPVAPIDSCEDLRSVADDVVCVITPEPFHSVGHWYADFSQTTEDEVREALERNRFSGRGADSSPTFP
jgi:predicted phosphoribosyltransferase